MTAKEEQETVVGRGRLDTEVNIWTSNTVDLARLRKLCSLHDFVREVKGGADWGEFVVKAENFNVLRGIRAKRVLSEAARAASAANIEKARNLRRSSAVDETLRERDV